MKKDELLLLALEYDLDVEDSMTKADIKNAIDDAGITDDDLVEKSESNGDDINRPAETKDEVLIRMINPTSYYSYGRYVFTKNDPFAVMTHEDSEAIIRSNGDLFRKASEGEIREFFS